MGEYVLMLQISFGVIFLCAVAAIVIALRDEPPSRRPAHQRQPKRAQVPNARTGGQPKKYGATNWATEVWRLNQRAAH